MKKRVLGGPELGGMTNAKVARVYGEEMARWRRASDAVFALAQHGNERFSEIVARLGATHEAVIALEIASARREAVVSEARARVGQQRFDLGYEVLLQRSPRYVRVRSRPAVGAR